MVVGMLDRQFSKQRSSEEATGSGQSKRIEDLRLITGTGKFIDDLKVRQMVYAGILRSPYAHAKIKGINVLKARSSPGVIRVFTGADAIASTKPFPQAIEIPVQDYCLAASEVVYVGQPVAAVVAESPYLAEDALSLIEVEYEPLDPVVEAFQGSQKSSSTTHLSVRENNVFHKILRYGDVNNAFSKADFIVKDSFVFESYSAMPLETYGIVADYNKFTGLLEIYDNCQMPLYSLANVSQALSISSNKIRFIEQDIGGGFGIKSMLPIYDVLIGMLAIKTGLPIKWIETRSEHMLASSHGTRRQYEAQVAVMKSGEILGLKLRAFEDVGAFVRKPGQTALVSCLRAFSGPYRFRAFEYDMNLVLTNKCPAGPSRGNGKNHHAFLLERIVNRVAAKLKLDPVAIRIKNFIRPEEFPYVTANGCLYDSGNYAAALERAADLIDYPQIREIYESANSSKRQTHRVGVGFALTIDPAASNMSQDKFFRDNDEVTKWGTSDTASIHMDNSGNVTVSLSSVPQGQGHESVAAAIVAKELGVALDNITVFRGFDSSRNIGTPTSGTYSSRFAAIAASALTLAAIELRQKLLKVGSSMLDVPRDELTLENNQVFVRKNKSIHIAIRELANRAYSGLPHQVSIEDRSLDSLVTYTHEFGRTQEEALTNLASTFAYQAHAAVVEIDVETGKAKILSYAVVDDSGNALDRTIVEGQVHGGTCNGIAAALYERFLYNGEGQLLDQTFNDYLAPTAMEIPPVVVELMETPTTFNPTGAKGVGESGALGPQPAIINAIEDALYTTPARFFESHLTPETIYDALRKT